MKIRRGTLILRFVALLAGLPLSTFALDPNEAPQNYILRRWDTEDGLPTNPSRLLLQTKDGYLWIATSRGLVRFDGLTFTTFRPSQTPGAPVGPTSALFEDRDGTLWSGTATTLHSYRNGHFQSYGAKEGLQGNGASALCVGPDGALWIGNNLGITRYVGGKFVKDIDTQGLNTIGTRHMFLDRHGNVWVVTGVQLLRCTGKTVTQFGVPDGLPALGIEFVQEDSDGRILVSTQSGLFRLDNNRFVKAPYGLTSDRIITTLLDHDGNLWVGSTDGLDRVWGNQVTRYTLPDGKSIGTVNGILEDREGTLWLASSAGLHRINNRRAATWADEKGISGTTTLSVKRTRDGSIWISSWAAGVVRIREGQSTYYRAGAPLSNENVTCIYEAPDGSIWFGNRGSAIDHLEGDRVTMYVYAPGLPTSRYATAMFMDDNGDLLIGIASRGLFRLHHGVIEALPGAPSLVGEAIWAIHRTRDGRLLIATTRGLFQREADKSWHPVPLAANDVVPIVGLIEDKTGDLWLATNGYGLIRLRGSSARSYGVQDGLTADSFSSVIDDEMGSIWVTHPGGIARIHRSELDALDRGEISQLNPVNFGRDDGMASASVLNSGSPISERTSDGTLLFATLKGVAAISPRNVQINPKPPKVLIESITLDGQFHAVNDERSVTIPPGVNRIEIQYTALSLIVPERQRFRYQLVGSDPTWINAGRSRIASYTHLAPGSYEFKLLACNNDGVWTKEPVTLMLTVTPKFYQTLWFQSMSISLLVAAVIGAVGFRIRQLKQRQAALARANAELDQRVRDRTAELEQREILFRLIFEHAPVGIAWSRADLGSEYHFNSAFCRILGLESSTSSDPDLLVQLTHPDDVPRYKRSEAAIAVGQSDLYAVEQRFVRGNGEHVHTLLAAAVVRDPHGAAIQHIRIVEDISALKRAQAELEATHKRLLEASRLAGMAEIATGVLHNVGNVLNSVNVSSTLVADGVRGLRIDGLARINELLHAHESDLARFFGENPKARGVAPYLASLASYLTTERQRLVDETEALRKSVDHIKQIVAQQQSVAQYKGIVESVPPTELVEDALKMTSVALDRHGVEVIREYGDVPPIAVERHKALQILTNLIQNAKQATDVREPGKRRLCIRIAGGTDTVRIEIEDNGIGIRAENLTRVFELGFTTRTDGHGFGLHSSANAAKEMRGSLRAESDGADRGARFILVLPIAQPAMAA